MISIYLNVLKLFMAQDMIYLNKMSHEHVKNVCLLFQHGIIHFLLASTLSNENFAVIRIESFMVVSRFSLVRFFFYLSLVSGNLWLYVLVWMSLNLIF